MIIHVSDLQDPALDCFARLTESQLRSRREPEKGIFIAESPKVIRLALNAGLEPTAFLMEPRHLEGQGAELIARCPDIPVYTADRETLCQLTGYELTRGILCAMRRPAPKTVEEVTQGAKRVAILEGIVDTTNVGAIFRSAAALNVDAVLLTPTCADPLLRRAVRVSMGTVFLVPWAYIGDSPDDWPDPGVRRMKELGFRLAAMALTDQSVSLDELVLGESEKLALVLGTEGDGLAAETIARCDDTVRIPMGHGVDSLNVAAAAAVAFWETRMRS
ncbi:MAG: RNA methyltransferase [Oscillospiraceae bacterium]|nr:RNA methyltransferase [Oscillospiraceae bacterium]